MPATLVQSPAALFAPAAAALLTRHEGSRLHADGGRACGVDDLVRWNKILGRASEDGVDDVLYLGSLNAYDWHTTLTRTVPAEAAARDPTAIVVTGLLDPFLTERLREPERAAFVRHSIAALNRLSDGRPVYCLEDFARCSRIDAVVTGHARAHLASPCRVELSRDSFALVPLREPRGVQERAARRGVLPVLPGLRQ